MGVIDGRVAIITGGARGIGASISRLFAREGASLVINDLGGAPDGSGGDEGPAKQIADEIVAAGGAAVSDGGDIGNVATGERLVARGRRAVRQAGHRRQRGRHPARPDDLQPGRAGLGRGDQGPPEGALLHGPPGLGVLARAAQSPGALPRHQLHLGIRPRRVSRPAELRGRQDGHRRPHLLPRPGPRPLRRHRQRDRAGRRHPAHRHGPRGQAREPRRAAVG